MKKINIISMILLACLTVNIHTQDETSQIQSNTTDLNSLFIQQSILYIKKHAPLIALIPIVLHYHKNIIELIKHQPLINSILFYFFLNYLCDSYSDYQQQQSLLDVIALLKRITLYLVISHGIKNHIHHKKTFQKMIFNDQAFLDHITEDLHYSFDEVTLITIKSYQEIKSSLQSLNIGLNIESEEFVFLCHASSISIHSLLYLVQNEPKLHQYIRHFEENPQTHLTPLLEHLKLEITQTFISLEQLLLKSSIHSQVTP